MGTKDKERWNSKHKNNTALKNAIKLVTQHAHLAKGDKALDIACGLGRHSKYLASIGFSVDALDVSSVAISTLNGLENIHAKEVDFDTYKLAKNTYDLIVCTYYLERKLFPQMVDALKSNGLILYETFVNNDQNERAPSNPLFLLNSGELESYFKYTCDILYATEFLDIDTQGNKVTKTSMVARKKV